jgi:hypothetical protein
MKDRAHATQSDADARTLSFADLRSASDQERFDVPPCDIRTNRFGENGG